MGHGCGGFFARFFRNALAIATGIHHCMTAEREIEEERVICETWLTEEPKGVYAFARISGKTYFRLGYFDTQKNDWVIPDVPLERDKAP